MRGAGCSPLSLLHGHVAAHRRAPPRSGRQRSAVSWGSPGTDSSCFTVRCSAPPLPRVASSTATTLLGSFTERGSVACCHDLTHTRILQLPCYTPPMSAFDDIIVVFWLILLGYWLLAAVGAKRNRRGVSWSREAGIRLALALAVLLLVRSPLHRAVAGTNSPALAGIGVALCGIGVAFALWARMSLGRNWGMPATFKAEPALVSTGPYAVVRHPIYGGIILAMVGTALVVGLAWLVVCILMAAYFLFSAVQEEQFMINAFPGDYPAYKHRTKMVIPFIF